jgi:hypothetical protein
VTIKLRRLDTSGQAHEPVRQWLSEAIAAASDPGCRSCRPGSPCPPHAADAVLNACRQERLFVMPADDADAIIAAARGDHAC